MRIGGTRAAVLAAALGLGGAHGCGPGEALPSAPIGASPSANVGAAFDLAGVMRQAHFAFRREGDAWSGGHASYAARVDEGGLTITPHAIGGVHRPARASLSLRTRAIGRGEAARVAERSAPAQERDGGLALPRGIAVERLSNTEEGVEQSFTFAAAPEGAGDLRVRLGAAGQRFAGETAQGLHFLDDETGLGVRIGRATWIDARGVEADVRVAFEGGEVVLTVPSEVVDASVYPAVLDPIIGPEWGMDAPIERPAPNAQGGLAYGNSLNPGSGGSTSIACGPSVCLVAWGDTRVDATKNDIFVARVDAATGALLDPTGIAVATGPAEQGEPRVAWDGTGFLVVFQDEHLSQNDGQIYGARVSTGGVVLEPGGFPIATGLDARSRPAVAFDGANYLVVWERENVTNARIEGARVTPGGVVLDPAGFAISAYGYDIRTPAIAWNGSHHLVVWSNSTKIQGARVTSAGVVADVTPIVVFDQGTGVTYPRPPDVASNGSDFFVVWSVPSPPQPAPQRVAGARVSAAGAILDPGGITLSTAPLLDRARVAFGAGNYVVAWDDFITGTNGDGTLRAARVTPSGALLDAAPGVAFGSTPEVQEQPAIAFTGSSFLTAWTDLRLAPPNTSSQSDVFAARLDASLASLDGAGFLVSRAANEQKSPAVAWNGSIYLAVWEDARPGGLFTDLYATRLTPSGTPLDPAGIVVSNRPGSQRTPAVATDGNDFLVAWEDGAGLGGNLTDLYATVVTSAGVVAQPSGIPVHVGDYDDTLPAIAFDGTNYLVVYTDGYIDYDLRGARVTPAGAVLDPNGFPIAAAAFDDQRNGSVAFDGTNFVVAWSGTTLVEYNAYAARVSPAGAVLDPNGFAVAATNVAETRPVVASAGGSSLVVYQSGGDLLGAIVSAAGAVSSTGLAVSKATGAQQAAALTWDGARYWVVWQDARDSVADIYGARLTASGSLLDANGIAISAGGPWSETAPAITRGPSGEVLVAYQRFVAEAPLGSGRVRARVVKATSIDGAPCAAPAECESGACVDGVCCASACAGTCMACSAAKTGGADGVCAAIKANTDPDGECADDGLACTTAACSAGACVQRLSAGSCLVGGACFASGALDPSNDCAACAPSTSASAFTPKPDGAACAADALSCTADRCEAGACAHPLIAGYCVIGGACVASGAADPANPCATCQPSVTTSAHTPKPDGTGCADDGVACTTDTCNAGVCTHALAAGACLIGGACFAAGALDPASACRLCEPSVSTSAFTAKPDGAACPSDGIACTADVCSAGACTHPQKAGTCSIGGACFAALAPNPTNECEACDPAVSAIAWTARPDGAACADDGLSCTADTCKGGACTHTQAVGTCLIGGACVAPGAKNPADPCAICAPAESATGWTPIAMCGLPDAGTDGGTGGADAGVDAGSGGADAGMGGAGGSGGSTSSSSSSSSSSSGASSPCVPFSVAACACPGGADGSQTCKADGAGYDACACDAGAGGAVSSSSSSGAAQREEGGCGCRTPGEAPRGSPIAGLSITIALAAIARRRAARRFA